MNKMGRMTLRSAIVLTAAAEMLCGCVNVPKTRLAGTIGGVPFSLESPKDSKLQGLTVEVIGHDSFGGTNFARVRLDSMEAKMNPEVITTTGDAQVKLVNAIGQNVINGIAAGAAAAGTGGASAVLPK